MHFRWHAYPVCRADFPRQTRRAVQDPASEMQHTRKDKRSYCKCQPLSCGSQLPGHSREATCGGCPADLPSMSSRWLNASDCAVLIRARPHRTSPETLKTTDLLIYLAAVFVPISKERTSENDSSARTRSPSGNSGNTESICDAARARSLP